MGFMGVCYREQNQFCILMYFWVGILVMVFFSTKKKIKNWQVRICKLSSAKKRKSGVLAILVHG